MAYVASWLKSAVRSFAANVAFGLTTDLFGAEQDSRYGSRSEVS